jgi:uncharacterized membrane protein
MQHATIAKTPPRGDIIFTSIAEPRGWPVQKALGLFSAAYFAAAFVTDLVYWQMPDVLWERFSVWLIVAGLVMAGLAAVATLIGLARGRWIEGKALPRAAGYALAVVLSLVNAFVHSRDGYTAVVPTGLILSGSVVVVLALAALASMALAHRSRVGG